MYIIYEIEIPAAAWESGRPKALYIIYFPLEYKNKGVSPLFFYG